MNKQLQEFARRKLKKGLSDLTDENRTLFKRMYSPNDLDKDINDVVDSMKEDNLDWAMLQVSRSLQLGKGKGSG